VLPAHVPATIVGAWSTLLWHRYVVELGQTLGAWRGGGVFDIVSSAAVGLGAALVVFAIVHKPTVRLAPARVPRRLQDFSFRALAVFAIVGLLALLDRTVARRPLEMEPTTLFCWCDEPLRELCDGYITHDETTSCLSTDR
jgi:hypothetical protein